MGSDLSVVNAARVSFAKDSDWEDITVDSQEFDISHGYTDTKTVIGKKLADRDAKLIKYLAAHKHWTPFAHPQISLHMKLPMFVQRQIDKHQIGFVVNEVSRRYVSDEPELYEPEYWRKAPTDGAKQGSLDEPHPMTIETSDTPDSEPFEIDLQNWFEAHNKSSLDLYNTLVEEGVAPEMARMVLPMNMYTESWKTGSLYAWANLYKLRIDGHAQKEIQEVAKQVGEILEPLFPVSWKALTDG